MKLLNYTTSKLVLLLFLIISMWGVVFYFAMHHEIMDETDDMLRSYRDIFIKKALNDTTLLNTTFETTFDRYSIQPIDMELVRDYKESWYNEEIYFPEGDEHIPVRVYKSIFRAPGDQYYELEVKMSTVERDDMIQTLIIYLVVLFLLLIICLGVGAGIILRKSFTPLKKLLHWIHSLVPGKPVPPMDNDTRITEFRQLNEAAFEMSVANLRVYELQKQYTENASHELQTPLAVVRNKLDQFTQQDDLTEKQLSDIAQIYESLNVAIKLNKSMLLLSRIENRQYQNSVDVDFNTLVHDISADLAEIYAHKGIRISIENKDHDLVSMNETLAGILIANLLKNAYLHTTNNGNITVVIEKRKLSIYNTGDQALDQEMVFKRFYQPSVKQEHSSGLGLSIVKSICDIYQFGLSYTFTGREHLFSIRFY